MWNEGIYCPHFLFGEQWDGEPPLIEVSLYYFPPYGHKSFFIV